MTTTATLKDDRVELRMTFETALNIQSLCRDRLREDRLAQIEFPNLPVKMEHSTETGYTSTITAIEDALR